MVATDLQRLKVNTYGATVRGRTIEIDGEPVGVAGVLHQNPPQAFSTMTDALREHPKAIVRFIQAFEEFLQMHYTRVYALASSREKNAPRCLERAGFEPLGTDVDGQEVYRWQIR